MLVQVAPSACPNCEALLEILIVELTEHAIVTDPPWLALEFPPALAVSAKKKAEQRNSQTGRMV